MEHIETLKFLDPQTLATVNSLELRSRMIIEGMMLGQHKSPFQGASVEFAQHRQYVTGDDTRHIDWKVFGRSDKLYIKQYQKETNLDLMIMVDTSGSMAYGNQNKPASTEENKYYPWRKFDHASSLAVALAYLGLQQQDRVGLTLFDDHVRAATRMSSQHNHWRSLVEVLNNEKILGVGKVGTAEFDPHAGRKTDLARIFDQIVAKQKNRSLIVIISDFFDDPALIENGLARLFHRRHDVILFQVMDDDELNFPFRSSSEFIGLESEGKIGLDPAMLKKAYKEVMDKQLDDIEKIARKFRFDYSLVQSSKSIGSSLMKFLNKRSRVVNQRGAAR